VPVPPQERRSAMKASVIVPVRNGSSVLPRLMAALDRQTLPRESFEVIVGDDGSSDGGTDGIETADTHVRVAVGPPLTSDAARNRAASLARSDVLAFCDADCIPAPSWLEAGISALDTADLVGGFIGAINQGGPTLWTLLDLDTWLDQERMIRWGSVSTQNLFVRRELFEQVGGFDEALHYFGDYEFAWRSTAAGGRLVFSRDAVVTTSTYDDRRSFFRKAWAVNHAYGWYEGTKGVKPAKSKLREWVPVVQTLRSRRRSGTSVLLDRKCLAQNGMRSSALQDLLALPIQYLVLPYLACVGQLVGWRQGRRAARTASGAS
jgi:glycosyltransferase involved in cell wall biosynthesis